MKLLVVLVGVLCLLAFAYTGLALINPAEETSPSRAVCVVVTAILATTFIWLLLARLRKQPR